MRQAFLPVNGKKVVGEYKAYSNAACLFTQVKRDNTTVGRQPQGRGGELASRSGLYNRNVQKSRQEAASKEIHKPVSCRHAAVRPS